MCQSGLKYFLFLFFSFLFLVLARFFSPAAEPDSRWLLIPGILNEFDTSLNTLEENTRYSNRLIGNLRNQVSSLLISIDKQQDELNQAWENYQNLELAALQRSRDFENSLEYLGASFRSLLTRERELERENTGLRISNARKGRTIILLASVIALASAVFIARVAILVKTGGWSGLLRRIFF